jgi:hypothetical protein
MGQFLPPSFVPAGDGTCFDSGLGQAQNRPKSGGSFLASLYVIMSFIMPEPGDHRTYRFNASLFDFPALREQTPETETSLPAENTKISYTTHTQAF